MSIITDPKEKMFATLGAIFFLIPHFMGKKTDFITLYMRQNFGIVIASFIVGLLEILLGWVPLLGMIFTLMQLALLFTVAFLAYMAYNGERLEFQMILKYADMLIAKLDFLKPLFTPKNI